MIFGSRPHVNIRDCDAEPDLSNTTLCGILYFMTDPERFPHNPYDKTIWDPTDPEHAIEDPFHGPDAVLGLLAIPPLKQPDGSYYVFGASYICGTNTFDNEGKPFIEFKAGFTSSFIRDLEEHRKWIEAFNADELPPREEMDLPEFRYEERPYFKFQPAAGTEAPDIA